MFSSNNGHSRERVELEMYKRLIDQLMVNYFQIRYQLAIDAGKTKTTPQEAVTAPANPLQDFQSVSSDG